MVDNSCGSCEREFSLAPVEDLTTFMLQAWMDDMAASDLSINTLRSRQAAVSSFCNWLVKRNILLETPSRRWIGAPPVEPAGLPSTRHHGCPDCSAEKARPAA